MVDVGGGKFGGNRKREREREKSEGAKHEVVEYVTSIDSGYLVDTYKGLGSAYYYPHGNLITASPTRGPRVTSHQCN